MSSTYGGVDYGTEERACHAAALQYMAPYGTPEYDEPPHPAKVMTDAHYDGWQWPSSDPNTVWGGINSAITELYEE